MIRTILVIATSLFTFTLQASPLRLALNWKPEPQFGGFYAADHAGLFKKAGLDVQLLPGGSGTPTLQMLAAGQAEFAIVSADELIVAADRGNKDLVALFATYQTNPQAFLTHAEKGYAKLEDLFADSKATLLWQEGLPYALYLKKKMGPQIKAKFAPYPGGIANFQHDPQIAQQCFATSEPLAAAKAGIKTKVFLVADAGFNPYTTVLATRRSFLKDHPAEVAAFVKVVRQGWADYLKDPTALNQHMNSLNKSMDLATFAASAQAQKPLIQTKAELGSMTRERWQALTDQLFELKLIKAKPAVETLFQNH